MAAYHPILYLQLVDIEDSWFSSSRVVCIENPCVHLGTTFLHFAGELSLYSQYCLAKQTVKLNTVRTVMVDSWYLTLFCFC
jgi:hypothetical protein